jgi:hypothetical protein
MAKSTDEDLSDLPLDDLWPSLPLLRLLFITPLIRTLIGLQRNIPDESLRRRKIIYQTVYHIVRK